MDLSDRPLDLDGYRAAMGFTDGSESITFRDLQERREVISRRLAERNESQRRTPTLRAIYRMVRPRRR